MTSYTIEQTAKLVPRFGGPYQIVNFISPVICKLQAQADKKLRRAHFGDLKPHVQAEETRSDQ